MWDKWVSIIDALILHLFVLGVIFLSMEGVTFPSSSIFDRQKEEQQIEQPLVDESQVLAEIERLKQEKTEKLTQQTVFENKKKEYEQMIVHHQERLEQLHQELKQEEQELAKIKVND